MLRARLLCPAILDSRATPRRICRVWKRGGGAFLSGRMSRQSGLEKNSRIEPTSLHARGPMAGPYRVWPGLWRGKFLVRLARRCLRLCGRHIIQELPRCVRELQLAPKASHLERRWRAVVFDRSRVNAKARASPCWIGGRRRPTHAQYDMAAARVSRDGAARYVRTASRALNGRRGLLEIRPRNLTSHNKEVSAMPI